MPGAIVTEAGVIQTTDGIINTDGMVTIIDSFEDGNVLEYTERGGSGAFDVVDESSVTPDAVNGTKLLRSNDSVSGTQHLAHTGSETTPSQGDTFSIHTYNGGTGHDMQFFFGIQDTSSVSAIGDNSYRIEVETSVNRFGLWVTSGGTTDQLDRKVVSLSSGTWYRPEVAWGENGDFSSTTLYEFNPNGPDTSLVTLSDAGTDTTFTSGDFSFHNSSSQGSDHYYDYGYIA